MQGPTPAPTLPAVPQAPPAPAAPPAPFQGVVIDPGAEGATASAVYEALKAQRRELDNQLEGLEDRRQELSERLADPMVSGADKKGVETRIIEIDSRISSVERQIAENQQAVARQAAVPGAVVERREPIREGPPPEAFVLGGIFIFVVLLPLSVAMARRIWRRSAATITKLPAELTERLSRLEQGMDAVAVEVERIGEGQRYMARLMGEDSSLRAIGAGAADPVEVKAREADAHYRR